MFVDTSTMTPEELEVFRLKDRLTSALNSKGVRANATESMAQLIGQVINVGDANWFPLVAPVTITSPNVSTAHSAFSGAAPANSEVTLNSGLQFAINYPTVSYRDRPIVLNPNNFKLLDIGFRTFCSTQAAASNTQSTVWQCWAHMFTDSYSADATLFHEFDSILDDGRLNRTVFKIRNDNDLAQGLQMISDHSATTFTFYESGNMTAGQLVFQYVKEATRFWFRFSRDLLCHNGVTHLRAPAISGSNLSAGMQSALAIHNAKGTTNNLMGRAVFAVRKP